MDSEVVLADDVRTVVESRLQSGVATSLNEDYLRGFLALEADELRTPFQEVHRLPPGTELHRESNDALTVRRVPSIDDLPSPSLRADAAKTEYLRVFDEQVDQMQADSDTLVAMVSGGLDSTFMVASLVRHATPQRPIHALVNVPVPEAQCRPEGVWEPDESDLVRSLASAYPGQIIPIGISNARGILALDSAHAHAELGWWPSLNPSNRVWLSDMIDRAQRLGAKCLFSGSMGNFTYSYAHRYVAREALGSGRPWEAVAAGRALHASGVAWRRVLRPPSPTDWQGYRRSIGVAHHVDKSSLAEDDEPVDDPRHAWLEGALSVGRSHASSTPPRAAGGIQIADPFAPEALVRVAAAVDPLTWVTGPAPRAFARVLAQGRVPDSIRLRTRRGLQSADRWWHMRHYRDRYFTELEMLGQTPVLDGWLDPHPTRERLERWPWGEPVGPPTAEILKVDRVLALADYIRTVTQVLKPVAY